MTHKKGESFVDKIKNEINSANASFRYKNDQLNITALAPRKPRRVRDRNFLPDLELFIGSRAFAFVECKANPLPISAFLNHTKEFYEMPYRMLIYRTPDGYLFFDKYNPNQTSREWIASYEELVLRISDVFEQIDHQKKLFEVKRAIVERIELLDLKKADQKLTELGLLFASGIRYSIKNDEYYFGLEEGLTEMDFFKELLEANARQYIYRYMNLSSFLKTIESRTYRMNSLTAMNDISEIDYADSVLINAPEINEHTNLHKFLRSNRKFISSCSSKKDDLTMWRLYGDDSKGICMRLKIDRNHPLIEDGTFFIAPVSYARRNGYHPKLSLLEAFVLGADDAWETFGLIDFHVWKHFFKPYEYSIEHEVRILHIKPEHPNNHDISEMPSAQQKEEIKTEWYQSGFGLLNTFIKFSFDKEQLPFKISSIIYGPNIPEKELNHHQLKAMLSSTNNGYGSLAGIQVYPSSISHYRSN